MWTVPWANPKRWSWLTWLGATGLAVAGVLAGAGIARAAVGPVGPKGRAHDPALEPHVQAAIAQLGVDANLNILTNHAYNAAFPDCPRRLDPADQSHENCVRRWLGARDLVAARLPAPELPTPSEQEGLATTGSAADIRGWLESLTPNQRSRLREILGANLVDPVQTAAFSGDDDGTERAVVHLKKTVEDYAEEHPFDALRQYSELKDLLGPKLDDLLRTAEQYKA